MPLNGGGGASSSAVRAGGAFVEIVGRDRLTPMLDALRKRFASFGSSIKTVGASLAKFGGIALAPLVGLTARAAGAGNELGLMAARTGVAVESLSALEFAAGRAGGSLADVESIFQSIQQSIGGADPGALFGNEAFERLRISIVELQRLNPEQQFFRIADALSTVRDPAVRAALATQTLGQAGAKLLPLMTQGADGIRAAMAEAQRLGAVVSADQAEAATTLAKSWHALTASLGGLVNQIGAALAPALSAVLEVVTPWLTAAGKWIAANKELVVLLGGVAAAVAGTGVALVGLGIAAQGVAAGFGVLAGAIGLILSPVGAITAALTGLGYLFVTQTESGQHFASKVGEAFTDLKTTAVSAWGGITNAVASGDLALAGEIAMQSLRVAWTRVVVSMTDVWNSFKDMFKESWDDMLNYSIGAFTDWSAFIERNTLNWFTGSDAATNAERDATKRRFDANRDAARSANALARQSDANEARTDLKTAQQVLADLLRRAAAQAEESAKPTPTIPSLRLQEQAMRLAAATRGMFAGTGANAAQVLAVGDSIQQKQLDVQRDIAKGVKGVEVGVNNLAQGLRFK